MRPGHCPRSGQSPRPRVIIIMIIIIISSSPRKDRTPSRTPAHSLARSTRRCAGGRGGGTS